MLWLVDFSRGSGRAEKFSPEQKASAPGAPAPCSGVWSWAVSKIVCTHCSVLSPGQLRSRLLLGFPLAMQTCSWSKQHSGLLFPPGGQEPRDWTSAPQCRPDPEGSHGPCSPLISVGPCRCVTSALLEAGNPALLMPFTAAVPTLEGPGTSEMPSRSQAETRGTDLAWEGQRVPLKQPAQHPDQRAQEEARPQAGSLQQVEALPVRLPAPMLDAKAAPLLPSGARLCRHLVPSPAACYPRATPSLHPALGTGRLCPAVAGLEKVFGPFHTIGQGSLWAMNSKPGFRLQRPVQEGGDT